MVKAASQPWHSGLSLRRNTLVYSLYVLSDLSLTCCNIIPSCELSCYPRLGTFLTTYYHCLTTSSGMETCYTFCLLLWRCSSPTHTSRRWNIPHEAQCFLFFLVITSPAHQHKHKQLLGRFSFLIELSLCGGPGWFSNFFDLWKTIERSKQETVIYLVLCDWHSPLCCFSWCPTGRWWRRQQGWESWAHLWGTGDTPPETCTHFSSGEDCDWFG